LGRGEVEIGEAHCCGKGAAVRRHWWQKRFGG
ncbi:hypothetical protein A2U01_0019734, partial [Trifolium medium]|nr:hypothetical protein [Trifolium medium]